MKKLLFTFLLCLILLGSTSGQQFAPEQKPLLGSQLNWGHGLSDGLVGLWLFNENPGPLGKVYDLSGSGNTGTLVADTHSVPGKFGSALDFDGTGDYVNCGDVGGLENVAGISVSAWIKATDAIPAGRMFIAEKAGTGADLFEFVYNELNNVEFKVINSGATVAFSRSTDGITDTNWHHVVGVYNGSNVLVYVNTIVGAYSGALTGNTEDGVTAPFTISTDGSAHAAGIPFNGTIDHMMAWNRALSASEIAELYRDPFAMFRLPDWFLWYTAPVGGAPQMIIINM